jgi:hypothetical protein
MCKVEGKMFDMMTDPGESLNPTLLGEGVGSEGQSSPPEEVLGDQVTACRVRCPNPADIILG